MNHGFFGSELSTGSADAEGIQVKGKSYESAVYEVPTSEERNVVHLIHGLQDVEIEPNQDGEMGFSGKPSINQPSVIDTGRTSPNSWAQVINSEGATEVDSKPQQSNVSWGCWEQGCPPSLPISHPLDNGWQLLERDDKPRVQASIQVKVSNVHPHDESTAMYVPEFEKLSQDCDASFDVVDQLVDSEDDLCDSFDSDDSQKDHDVRKKNKWLRPFFESFDNLCLDQINEKTRQWHCPACQDGPGAINWFTSLQSLMTHAKTKGRIRMRLHRELAELLEEELQRRGILFIQPGEAFGKWKGLCEVTTDREIVWPPMVIVMNTALEKDENDKWKGMGNQELLEYFSTYEAVKARHSYGPKGHRGMSVLVFEASETGYLEAERLHKHFLSEGRDRCSWESDPALFYPGGKRQLYGFLASNEDLIIFNKHSHGKTRLKFDMRSYQEMVAGPMKKMSSDNQKLIWLKDKVMQHDQRLKVLEEAFGRVTQKLHDTIEENRILRIGMKVHHEENKEEVVYQECSFKDQMDKVHHVNEEKERALETSLQEDRMNAEQSDVTSRTIIDHSLRKEELQSSKAGELETVEDFEAERE